MTSSQSEGGDLGAAERKMALTVRLRLVSPKMGRTFEPRLIRIKKRPMEKTVPCRPPFEHDKSA